jgi:RHS repeat-associated protein
MRNRAVQSYGQGVSAVTPTGFNSGNNENQSPSGWVYDLSGNITADPGQSAYAYDAENRQTAYCMNASTCSVSGATMAYSYDGDGERVQTTAAVGAITTFVYDATGQVAAEYGSAAPPCTQTCYVTVDSLGSTRMVTDGTTGNCVVREDYLPFGQAILGTSGDPRGSCYNGTTIRQQFTSKERDAETGLDFYEARYMSSAQGRFTSPDPFGGHFSDPQTLNRYVYGRNNPLRFTDSTGLDFYLDCKGENAGCNNGHVGVTTSDENGKLNFTPTLVQNDANGNLVDQHGAQYSGSFDQHGIQFSAAGSTTTYSGEFAANTPATTLSGSGIFAGFTGVFNGNGLNTNIAQGSLFGSPQAFRTLLSKLVGPNPGFDPLNGFHPGTIQYRGGNDNGADPHLSFDLTHQPDAAGLLFQPFHFDGAYPYGDVSGFVQHSGSVLKNLFETQVLRQKDTPPPLAIPH